MLFYEPGESAYAVRRDREDAAMNCLYGPGSICGIEIFDSGGINSQIPRVYASLDRNYSVDTERRSCRYIPSRRTH